MKHRSALLLPLACAIAFPWFATAQSASGGGIDLDDLLADDEALDARASIADPLEPVNRAIFAFNDGVYMKVIKPFSRTYSKVMPDPVEKGIGNVFRNAKFPSRFVGNLLQGRLKQAGRETGKFLINTTVGLGGILAPADEIKGLETSKEDIGQAFGRWGIKHGFYIVLPFIGPTSLRDFAGDIADDAVEPLPKPWTQVDSDTTRNILRAVELINSFPAIINIYESMKRSAVDPYASVRNAYAQRRSRDIAE